MVPCLNWFMRCSVFFCVLLMPLCEWDVVSLVFFVGYLCSSCFAKLFCLRAQGHVFCVQLLSVWPVDMVHVHDCSCSNCGALLLCFRARCHVICAHWLVVLTVDLAHVHKLRDNVL